MLAGGVWEGCGSGRVWRGRGALWWRSRKFMGLRCRQGPAEQRVRGTLVYEKGQTRYGMW